MGQTPAGEMRVFLFERVLSTPRCAPNLVVTDFFKVIATPHPCLSCRLDLNAERVSDAESALDTAARDADRDQESTDPRET